MPTITSSPNERFARGRGHTIKVLVIDDDPFIRDALKLVLESNGYEIDLVADGREGIIKGGSGRFCIAIVDLFLSDISGLTAIQGIREQQPYIPIILITGNGSPEAFSHARRLGVVGILAKPFRPTDILQLVAQAHTQWAVHGHWYLKRLDMPSDNTPRLVQREPHTSPHVSP